MEKDIFFWSDGWSIDGEEAWFVDAEKNDLLFLNLKTNKCDYAVKIPYEGSSGFRMNPRCLKCGEEVFLFPDIGKYIWVYQVATRALVKIEIENPDSTRLAIWDCWREADRIFAVSIGLKKVLEIDILKKKIVAYYSICRNKESHIGLSTKIGNLIYSVSVNCNEIYQVDVITGEMEVYTIPQIEGGIYTICFDGKKFWMTGCNKEIYIWDKTENTTKVLKNFPDKFGFYCPEKNKDSIWDDQSIRFDKSVFTHLLLLGQYIWCIPRLSNQILYVDKDTYEIQRIELSEEAETWDTLMRWSKLWTCKFRLEAVRDNRYIVIYSVKNDCCFEIDVLEKGLKRKKYHISDDYFICTAISKEILREESFVDKLCFGKQLFLGNRDQESSMKNHVGKRIHEIVSGE